MVLCPQVGRGANVVRPGAFSGGLLRSWCTRAASLRGPGVAKDGLPWPKAGTKARLRASNRRTLLGDAKNAAGRRPGILESLEEALGLRRPECFCAANFAQHR